MDPQEAVDLVDENTILVCAILGSVFLVWDARTRFLIERMSQNYVHWPYASQPPNPPPSHSGD